MTPHSPINDSPSAAPTAPRRKPVPGKGFQKTRRGCFNCKRRRVKCSEHRPECQGCRRMRLPCVYPATVLPDPQTVSSAPTVKVCLDHLRFFHHFLAEAYPPHPYGASAVWQDVAALSHKYEFLASSILALAAQHLTVSNKADYSVQALNLRISAIRGLNNALSQPGHSAADADARYAAIIGLTFQSTYMPDGLMEFIAMMRGWMLISTTLVTDHQTSMFRQFTRESWVGSMKKYIEEQHETTDDMVIEDFLASLRILQPLLQGIAELQYLSTLERLAVLSKTSPREALLEMVFCYALTNKMTDEDYTSFTDPSNYRAQILLAHFLLNQLNLDIEHQISLTNAYSIPTMSTMIPTITTLGHVSSTASSATPSCTTAVPDKYGYVPPESCNANYGFYPNWEDNTAFAVAFGLSTVAHLAQAIFLKKKFCWVIVMGASWECICFIARALGARDQQQAAYVTVSTLLFLLAPIWINAFIYMIVARLVHFVIPQRRVAGISAQWLAKIFVTFDVMCFIIQAVGGGMLASDNADTSKLGQHIYMAGIGIQLGCVVVFLVIHSLFYREFVLNASIGKPETRSRWINSLCWVVYIVLVLIVVRVIFRLVEFGGGANSNNVVLRHEEFQLYLDALPMLIALVMLNVVHPGQVLKGPDSDFPSAKIKWWHGRSVAFETLELSSTHRSG
ncbi:Protein RTM1 [Fusarium austroafricanum]|uniref:Protein RTM1 n=1 Tax=Fusarium austroafricanum TaxID=2364996 RepID=A0A8H4NP24_9HYPO|nr:Protein RTM1 [Fusarium austroafricanum]